MTEKISLRREIRNRRRALSVEFRLQAACGVRDTLVKSKYFKTSRNIACYIAFDGELDLAPFMQTARAAGKRIFLPRLTGLHARPLSFCLYEPHVPLSPNRYGIPEPPAGTPAIKTRFIDLIVAPLVAFDRAGNRLGMGGGYYDRALGFMRFQSCWNKPQIVGVAYEFQCVKTLPAQRWDIPLHAVVTETASYSW
ncbi:MAG: 5-formyltetrahydrofolate cyclo-ligase [Gammaproteobacteria bacterium]|nr:5-formyltetrahydrofolate cyclo-ligase [Gammaproteobacteria bacterium]